MRRSISTSRSINADNLVILLNHVRCAAFELPFEQGEPFGTFKEVEPLLEFLAEDEKTLHHTGKMYRWVAPDSPSDSISLRTGTSDTIVIQDMTDPAPLVIGQIDRVEVLGDLVGLPERQLAAACTDADGAAHRSPKIFRIVLRSVSRSAGSSASLSCRIG